jgi:pimeloyl-ACP methyl ester carboxylesterase
MLGPKLPPDTDAIIDRVLAGELPKLVGDDSGWAMSGDIQIWYERISPQGASKGTVLLLIGMGGDGLLWPPRFVHAFVDAGYHVIRYDHRGTGLSDWMKNWSSKQPYTLADMAGDAIAVLNAVGVRQAHLVGLSMGGMIAQEIALSNSHRVATLTLMMTSGYAGDPDLPQPSSRYFIEGFIKGFPLLRYRLMGGERNLIKERIAKQIAFIGHEGLDVKELAELVAYDLRHRRGINLRAPWQHLTAITIAGSRHERLRALDVPTLVIHGTRDQLLPVEHGKKLAETIPNAKGLWLEGVGHVFPVSGMEEVIGRILAHLEAATAYEREL